MTTALKRGRRLDPRAVAMARTWRENRIKQILKKNRLELTPKQRNEARRLTGRWDFWNYK